VLTTSAAASPSVLRALSGSGGIRVSVAGSTLGPTTDDSGLFTLSGVPSGRAELRFEAPGIDARLEVEGLAEGQILTLTVHLSDSGASSVERHDGDEIEFRGSVVSKNGSILVVAGRTVLVVDGTTALRGRDNQPISLADVGVGAFVQVEGWLQPDDSILAKDIKLEDEDGEDEDENEGAEVRFLGTIGSVSPLTVSGTVVTTNDSTRILDHDNNPIGLGALTVGLRVEVEGHQQSDSVLAKKIKIED